MDMILYETKQCYIRIAWAQKNALNSGVTLQR